MSAEWFYKLREIDSLTKMHLSQLKLKSDQEARLSKLVETRNDKLSLISTQRQEQLKIKDDLAQLENQIQVASTQKQRMIDIGGDEVTIAQFTQKISDLEDRGFSLLNEEENLISSLGELKNFLVGLEKTYLEIQAEVESEVATAALEIKNLELRLEMLKNELPEDFRSLLEKTVAKKLAHGPFTRTEQGSCYFCRYKISRLDESEIDLQYRLKICPQCSRIFIPYGT